MADIEPLQTLTAALQACSAEPPTAGAGTAAAARAALGASDAAAQALLRLAADTTPNGAALEDAVSAITPWARVLEQRLGSWEAALGAQPARPEKAALNFPFRGSLFGPQPPPPGARRRPGATAGPERCAARLQAAAALTLLDTGLACLQARLPPPAAERGALDVPPEPSPLEEAAFAVLRRLEDTGLPYPVRAPAGGDASAAGQATAAGIRALGTCCSILTRLLRLASRRDHAQPEPQPQAEQPGNPVAAAVAEGGGQNGGGLESLLRGAATTTASHWDDLAAKCKPVTLITAMDTVYDASAVLTYWAPRRGKALGREHQAAWDSCILLVEYLWGMYETPRLVDGDALSYGTAQRYGSKFSRYIALSPVLAYHAWLCDRAPELRSAPPAELAAWAAAMNRVLSLLTEPFVNRVKGIADGGAVGGPAAAFDSQGRSDILTRSAAVLRLLPALAAAAADAADGSAAAEAAGGMAAAEVASGVGPEVRGTEQLVLEVGQMLVQLVAAGCASFNAEMMETTTKGQKFYNNSFHHICRGRAVLGLELLPALVAPPLAVLSANGPALAAAARWILHGSGDSRPTAEAREAAVQKWLEWHNAIYRLCELAWSLGEEMEAGAAGSPFGNCRLSGQQPMRHIPFVTADPLAIAAEEAAKAAGVWPPREPAAAQHLLARWHTIRAAVLPPAPPEVDGITDRRTVSRLCRIALRLEQRLPHTCRQLVTAAAAALDGSSAVQLQAALVPLLDAAGTACKLVLLACCDADHRLLLGIAEAAPANDAPELCPPCHPYRPIDLMLAACEAAAACVQRLLAHPSVLPPEQQEYARRRTRALLLQLSAAAEAAAGAGEPLASQVQAEWSGGTDGPQGRLLGLLGTLLEACGSMESGTQVQLEGSLQQGLAEARAMAGSEVEVQLALATLSCANPACLAAGAGGSEAVLPSKRCSGCSTARFSSILCQREAWIAGHKHACRTLAAAAASGPPAAPLPCDVGAPRKRESAVPSVWHGLGAGSCS